VPSSRRLDTPKIKCCISVPPLWNKRTVTLK
jgi:hypothetical protein